MPGPIQYAAIAGIYFIGIILIYYWFVRTTKKRQFGPNKLRIPNPAEIRRHNRRERKKSLRRDIESMTNWMNNTMISGRNSWTDDRPTLLYFALKYPDRFRLVNQHYSHECGSVGWKNDVLILK